MEIRSIHLSLGSNLGNKIEILSKAIQLIDQNIGEVIKTSSVYETEALGFETKELFNNCCIEIKTSLQPIQLLQSTQLIEQKIGRIKTKKDGYESRKIDIDIIFYGSEIFSTGKLTVPHPHFRERNFVLYPLEEIAPNKIDPIKQLTISQLKKNSLDFSWINRLKAQISIEN